jgi:hypothetical protein
MSLLLSTKYINKYLDKTKGTTNPACLFLDKIKIKSHQQVKKSLKLSLLISPKLQCQSMISLFLSAATTGPSGMALHETLTVTQSVKKSLTFYKTQRFNTMFTAVLP